jgi:cytochrome P450/NADPH-cytochrome P450 reductase
MTVKPLDFYIKVKRRPGKDINVGLSGAHHGDEKAGPKAQESGEQSSGRAITILYGSNAGTCKSFAEDLASEARSLGFAPNVSILDAATEEMPKDITLVIITPSYEGKPPDNAKKFVSWLEAHSDDHSILSGRKYAVFGVGNSEWASTFHRIPKLVDSLMGKLGAEAIAPTGFADVKVDPIGPWEAWREGLWARLQVGSREEASGPSKGLNAVISKAGSVAILGGEEMSKGVVKENRDLGGQEVGPAKKHMELELRDGVSYRTGKV